MKQAVRNILNQAGVEINGKRPWDIQIKNENFYPRILAGGSLALGESYMDGWWDCEAVDQFIYKILKSDLDKKVKGTKHLVWYAIKARLLNQQRKSKARVVGEVHYDVGNELYKNMLDKRMIYSCGYWRDANNLDEAQEAKLDLICKKLKLKPGMSVLDIGCGWGGLAKFMAERYQAKVTGITISKRQAELAKEICANHYIKILLEDYRDLKEKFDRVVSVGMFEHVGCKNYNTFMKTVDRCLENDGLFLLHTIGGNNSVYKCDPWFDKYIFPGGMLPSVKQIGKAIEGLFIMEDWHNFGTDYDKTLMAWFNNFNSAWPKLREKYGDKFYQMWKYYLLSLAGGFRARNIQLWQIVFSKAGSQIEYKSVR
ncbi:MAG: cyclopropane fatty acyl phospholipid synthase [Patescibacteria group bacterium]